MDIAALRLPAAASLAILAMAYAAITPGYLIAAAIFCGTTLAIFIAHLQVAQVVSLDNQLTDGFMTRAIVTVLASAGMAVVVRVATDAEARASGLAANNRERLDALEALNRIVSRFDGTQPVESMIQDVVDDIAREFDISLVSMYLPDGDGHRWPRRWSASRDIPRRSRSSNRASGSSDVPRAPRRPSSLRTFLSIPTIEPPGPTSAAKLPPRWSISASSSAS